MKFRLYLVPGVVVLAVIAVVGWASSPNSKNAEFALPPSTAEYHATLDQLNQQFATRWKDESLAVAKPAGELLVLRRLSLSLHGTLPSLAEVRQFEADDRPDRLNHWTARMLADVRYADYFAERLARGFVGVENGAFIIFRRGRFVEWLSEQLQENRPYDDLVREILAGTGLWTGEPATNFITAASANNDIDENKLAGRAVRAFLGQRIDCAQCHDHPFDDWKQEQFEGLAAHFGQVGISVVGVQDKPGVEYTIEDSDTLEERVVKPAVPFHEEWLPEEGTRRERLAGWITHPENRRFERAIANRVWGLLFGRPYLAPVDDLPHPDPDETDVLDILGADFRENGYDLRRLIHLVSQTRVFRMASTHATEDPDEFTRLDQEWAVFPMTRLRPEQLIGSMLQAASVQTIDQNSQLLVRAIRFFRERDFINEYGDFGEDELDERSGTIPQALQRMNGNLSRELTEVNLFSAAGRIQAFAPSDELCLDACYLVCLSRRPSDRERDHFLPQLRVKKRPERQRVVEDIYWSLFNSPEFSWNH